MQFWNKKIEAVKSQEVSQECNYAITNTKIIIETEYDAKFRVKNLNLDKIKWFKERWKDAIGNIFYFYIKHLHYSIDVDWCTREINY